MLSQKELKVLMHVRRLSSLLGPLAPLALLAMIVASMTMPVTADVIEAVLVKVNGEILTKTDLEQRQVLALRARGIQPADDEALKKAIADITPTLLVETIDEMLLVQRAKELGYKMSEEEFNKVVTRIRTDNKLDSDGAFQAALKQEGMTMADLRASLEKQMQVTRIQQAEVMGKINITEEEARKYHAEHVQDFTRPGQVTIREIQIACREERQGHQRRPRRRGEGQGRGRAQAHRRRRGIRTGGSGSVDLRDHVPTAVWSGRSILRS